nr:hypothetical protein [Tanacetum cinerariifolium]
MDAKTLFAAIQTRFGGNEATKKTLLKQMYKNFSAPSTESLDSIFNRLQKISYMADDEVPINMAFSDSELEFKGYGPKTSNSVSKDISNEVKESPDAPLVKELVSDDKLENKTVFPTVAKIEFVRPK